MRLRNFRDHLKKRLDEQEIKELEMLQAYLPQQMPEEQIREIVLDTIREINATSVAEMGKVMGALMPKVKGKADGGLVSKIVKESLNS